MMLSGLDFMKIPKKSPMCSPSTSAPASRIQPDSRQGKDDSLRACMPLQQLDCLMIPISSSGG